LELAVLVGFGGVFLPSGLWAGLTFLLTWWLLGLFALRAFFGHGKQRDFWLGATLIGAGFLVVAFARFEGDPWPIIPTVALLDDIRPWMPAVMNGSPAGWDSRTAQNARIYKALEQKIRMSFGEETPLEDVFKHIQTATADADGKGIPIQSGEMHPSGGDLVMTPTVRSIDFDGISLRTSLSLCLKQLDCTYHVKDGSLVIHSLESQEEAVLSAGRDAYQIVGHCLLAMIAAVIGGAGTTLVRKLSRGREEADATASTRD
jgi:hypothetical protein